MPRLRGLALLIVLLPGCQSLQGYRPVAVLVRDAETKQPLPGAEVKVWYPFAQEAFPPHETAGRTGPDGVTCVDALPRETGIMIKGAAPGYFGEDRDLPPQTVRACKPAGWFAPPPAHDKSDLVIELFAEPRVEIELVVPTGYLGPVKVHVDTRPDFVSTPGQRKFAYPVPANGEVEVQGSRLLARLNPSDFHGRYADGTSLDVPPQPDPIRVGLRWWKCDEKNFYFLIGTETDLRRQKRAEAFDGPEHSHGSGGGGGGGGRGHKRRRGGDSSE